LTTPTQEPKTAAVAPIKQSVLISFKKGSSNLSETEKAELRSLAATTKDVASFDKVIVAAWADAAYPTKKDATLSDSEKTLANKRATAVKEVLESAGARSVEVFSPEDFSTWMESIKKQGGTSKVVVTIHNK
jgi:outer membrane protein OmpA-like peptidoglycan-associated protein